MQQSGDPEQKEMTTKEQEKSKEDSEKTEDVEQPAGTSG